jgi:hypothetical protein
MRVQTTRLGWGTEDRASVKHNEFDRAACLASSGPYDSQRICFGLCFRFLELNDEDAITIGQYLSVGNS